MSVLCGCGCGRTTEMAKRTDARLGHIKGQPLAFLRGHYLRPKLGCRVDGCEGSHSANGLCPTHLSRLRRTGSTEQRTPAVDLFDQMVPALPDSECWPWLGRISTAGYGRIGHQYAHRVACERAYGPPPNRDSVVCHSCDNPPCVNPSHLRWGTQLENVHESIERGRR